MFDVYDYDYILLLYLSVCPLEHIKFYDFPPCYSNSIHKLSRTVDMNRQKQCSQPNISNKQNVTNVFEIQNTSMYFKIRLSSTHLLG